MQAKHTPGPWAISLSADARVDDRITGANGATVVRGSIGYTLDAALIAAAPDMLAALQRTEQMLSDWQHTLNARGARVDPLLDEARAVIARATGEA